MPNLRIRQDLAERRLNLSLREASLTDAERQEIKKLTAVLDAAYADPLEVHQDAQGGMPQRWGPWQGYMHEGERWQERLDLNHGRKRRRLLTLAQIERDESGFEHDDPADHAATPGALFDGSQPQREYRVPLRDEGSQTVDLLAAGGWHIEHAGSTGGARGRPRRGATSLDLIRQRLKAALGRPVSEVLADAQLFPVQS